MSDTASRFIVDNDEKVDSLIYTWPIHWWSRPYEYAWASKFADEEDVVLDAACGMSHPFKFHLADKSKLVYACDIDNAIEVNYLIRESIRSTHGEEAVDAVDRGGYLERIAFKQADITALPYEDGKFDKVFCISVLEHLESEPLTLNTLQEFKRVLKDDGLLVITYDYPDITPEVFTRLASKAGFEYASDYDHDLPQDAIYSGPHSWKDLRCFRALLRKVK